ncbi:MAG: NuA4 histone acetyltransferase subunit [Bathelium mastoideum]|nr:MAG: NuA4 histone acetyltransferase subunit [Bathelium mastoideum]
MAAAPASSMPPSTAEYGGASIAIPPYIMRLRKSQLTPPGDEVSALVLDPGYSTTRAGFAGEDVPKSVVPTYYGKQGSDAGKTRLFFGENAIHSSIGNPAADFHIDNPMSTDSTVEDWDVAKQLWEYSITSRLTGPPPGDPAKNGLNDPVEGDVKMEDVEELERPLAECPLLMTEPSWNPAKAREKAIEIAMEDWGAPAFFMVKDGVSAAFSAGKPTALVIDIGAATTKVTPVVDGLVLKKGVQKSPFAGNFVSQQLRTIFSTSQPVVPLMPHYMVQAKVPVDAGQPSQATYKSFAHPPPDSFRKFQEERVLLEFKETVVQVWPGNGRFNEDQVRQSGLSGRPFEMPDGYNQVFGAERFKATEGLFDAKQALPSPDGSSDHRPKPEQTISAMIQNALAAVDVDSKPHMLNNVVVTGSSSLLYGFTDRINAELQALFPSPRVRLSAPSNTAERKFAPWIGGSILASLGSFHQMWVSKSEFAEHGRHAIFPDLFVRDQS